MRKQAFGEDEIAIYDDAVIYLRGEHWQFRMWLPGEGKYARRSLNTRHQGTAIERGRDLYLDIMARLRQGKRYFSINAKQAAERYLAHRQRDVAAGLIVPGRWATMRAHLNHWQNFVGRDTRLSELDRGSCEDYHRSRLLGARGVAARQVTIANEQSTINAMMLWLFRQGDSRIDGFDFPRMPRLDRNDEAVRRSTFEAEEVVAFGAAVERWCDRVANRLDEDEWRQRSLAGHYFLISATTGLRTGEQLQLRWSDVRWLRHHSRRHGGDVELVEIRVRAETSKVRTSRRFFCRDGGLLRAWEAIALACLGDAASQEALVFSLDGLHAMSKRALHYHFAKLVELAGIQRAGRNIVPYSFRHYFITQRIISGLGHAQVAEMCGTSITQIERTYFHLNDRLRITHALAGYEVDGDGLVITQGG